MRMGMKMPEMNPTMRYFTKCRETSQTLPR